MYVNYMLASGRGDVAMREQVRGALGQWIRTMAAQFAALSQSLPADAVASNAARHDGCGQEGAARVSSA